MKDTTIFRRPRPGQVEDRDRPSAGAVEDRQVPAESVTVDGRRVRGVIPYGVESRDLGGWTERIERGALRNARLDDLVARVDHAGVPLGRFPGTLEVEDRDDGLHWSVELPESRSDIREAVERGDLQAGSWRMVVGRDRWENNVRIVEEIRELQDVSVVTRPAYGNGARVELRSTNGAQRPADRRANGALRVEDRDHQGDGRPVEDRILEAMAAIPQGESRDLLSATTAAPVEPTELSSFLWDRLRPMSVVLESGVPVIPTNRGKIHWPTITGDVTADFFDELDTITESDPTLDDLEVPVKAIKALVRGSSEAFEDSDPDLLRVVQSHLQKVLALRLDKALLEADTATQPKGFDGLAVVAGTVTIDAAQADSTMTSC